MSTIGKLFGRSPFSQIQQHMEQVSKCIDKMSEAIDAVKSGQFDLLDNLSTEVSQLEHQADQIKDDIRERLLKRFFMPIDRSEVLEILSLQDSLADTAEDVCKVQLLKKIYAHDKDFSVGEFHLWMRVTRVLSRLANVSENLADRILKTLSLK
jgi:predicted phosphate transport protein (TIGR00153 family)